MVVETPRGSGLKLEYDPELGAFTVGRALSLGVTYPYDWGFVPSTLAEDGDPLDALAIHDGLTFPGVVLPCTILGMVQVLETTGKGLRRNPRLVLCPSWNDAMGRLERRAGLPPDLRRELERFFVAAALSAGKNVRTAWAGRKPALKVLDRAKKQFDAVRARDPGTISRIQALSAGIADSLELEEETHADRHQDRRDRPAQGRSPPRRGAVRKIQQGSR